MTVRATPSRTLARARAARHGQGCPLSTQSRTVYTQQTTHPPSPAALLAVAREAASRTSSNDSEPCSHARPFDRRPSLGAGGSDRPSLARRRRLRVKGRRERASASERRAKRTLDAECRRARPGRRSFQSRRASAARSTCSLRKNVRASASASLLSRAHPHSKDELHTPADRSAPRSSLRSNALHLPDSSAIHHARPISRRALPIDGAPWRGSNPAGGLSPCDGS